MPEPIRIGDLPSAPVARLEAHAGEIVVVPAGAVHRFTASAEGTLRFVSIHPVPAMSQEFLEDTR